MNMNTYCEYPYSAIRNKNHWLKISIPIRFFFLIIYICSLGIRPINYGKLTHLFNKKPDIAPTSSNKQQIAKSL